VSSRRTAIAAALTLAVLAALLGSWFASGWSAVRAEQRAVRAAPRLEAERTARTLAATLDAQLDELASREDQRPWYHYQALIHDPRGAALGNAVTPSPLLGPDDPLVSARFQIDARGKITLPGNDESVPELQTIGGTEARRLENALADVSDELRGRDPAGEQIAMAQQRTSRVEVLDNNAYQQNVQAQQVYQQAREQKAEPLPLTGAPVAVTVAPLIWRPVTLDGAPVLAAVRRVETPDGTLHQGLVVRLDTAAAFVRDRADLPATVTTEDTGAPVTSSGGTWHIRVDDTAAIRAADLRAAGVARAFLARFVPTAVLAIVCAALVVLLVARADRAARQRAQFAAAAAHELRTPLAGLQLYGDMLADGLGNPERSRDYARHVSEEAARLGRVVSNVLDFSRLERGNLSVAARTGDAAAVARAAVDRARPALERAGVTLTADIPDEPLPAQLDDDALARILSNLIDNAEKYGRDASDRTIAVTARRAAGSVTIEVRDAGPGIAQGAAQALFAPFARGGAPGDGPPGLGLGLALSRSLARAMGGDLAYRPSQGGGATFVVTLTTA
jgi:signal transduction histidine kinase